jgi:quercetin 2,3-dioxygenase
MNTTAPGRIYLSDQRYLVETESIRRYSTFNTNIFYHDHLQPLGPLQQLDDIMLDSIKSSSVITHTAVYYILLPVTGEVAYQQDECYSTITDTGQLLISTLPAHTHIVLSNLYPQKWINYLQLTINISTSFEPLSSTRVFDFDLIIQPNELIKITTAEYPFNISIGHFEGKQECIYHLQNQQCLFYAFVITGIFELEGRLLHERDGLALWQREQVELKALSLDAVIIVLEIKF